MLTNMQDNCKHQTPYSKRKVPACYAKSDKPVLYFGKGNAKLTEDIATFDLPPGWTCPGANHCLAKADRETGKIWNGPKQTFRCYAASMEAVFPALRARHWANLDALKTCKGKKELFDLILKWLPESQIYRLHAYGDFFSQAYFDAWVMVAMRLPERIFYAYTKSLHFYAKRLNVLPRNFRLVASWDGKFDHLIEQHKLRSARVFFSEEEIKSAGLKTDHTDALAYVGTEDFALLLHGTQSAGTPAAKAWQKIKKETGGYSLQKKIKLQGRK